MDLERYKDKPFLLLLESFVLDAVGELPPAMEHLATSMSTKFFGHPDWKKRLREEVGFPKELRDQIAALWAENRRIAAEKGAELVAAEFAQALVEANFAEVIEMATGDLEAENPDLRED
jgi:hypothetical protein